MSGTNAVELRGVVKSFRGTPVLRGVDLAIATGETFTILGGSGSGKSVCLKHMIGLLRADAGRVAVLGTDVTRLKESQWVAIRKRCGVVFQGAALFDSLSVYENVAYPLRQHERWPEERVAERVEGCLDAVGLAGTGPMLPAELSGGMRKRVGVARAIALEPELVLYDEPTTGLDPANARRIGELIAELNQRLRVTSVVVTHDLDLCFAISDRVGLLKNGRIVDSGTVEEMRSSSHPAVCAFLEGAHDAIGEDEPARKGNTDGNGS
jgi:phospholipid/cholesterol/gamma-HCH transport system ATP-binding protein